MFYNLSQFVASFSGLSVIVPLVFSLCCQFLWIVCDCLFGFLSMLPVSLDCLWLPLWFSLYVVSFYGLSVIAPLVFSLCCQLPWIVRDCPFDFLSMLPVSVDCLWLPLWFSLYVASFSGLSDCTFGFLSMLPVSLDCLWLPLWFSLYVASFCGLSVIAPNLDFLSRVALRFIY